MSNTQIPTMSFLRKLAFLLLSGLYLPGISVAQTANQTNENLVGTAVVLRTLDKVTATTEDYTVKIGETLQYGSLDIAVRHCEKRPPTEIPETYAFLQISDTRLNGQGEELEAENEEMGSEGSDARIFSGWMFASKPAVSALDHRVYDVWVIDCKIPQQAVEGLRR